MHQINITAHPFHKYRLDWCFFLGKYYGFFPLKYFPLQYLSLMSTEYLQGFPLQYLSLMATKYLQGFPLQYLFLDVH